MLLPSHRPVGSLSAMKRPAEPEERNAARRGSPMGLARAALLGWSLAASVGAQVPDLQRLSETVIDAEGLNFATGPWGTCINGQTFQEHAMASHRGYQYATYFHGSGRLSVARRKLPDGPWQNIRFDDYRIRHNDVHNVAVLGLCPGDGTIHLAFDHHGHPLHYRVSRPGVATEPDAVTWEPGLFGPTTNALHGSGRLQGVTYPMFAPAPDSGLLLYYRTGGSGDGDWHFAEYDPAASRWGRPLKFLSKDGDFQGDPTRCAYPNGLQYDARGRLHVSWCWRETPDLKSNHDVLYAFSDDRGRTWRNTAGQAIGSPIGVNSPGIVVAPLAHGWGMMNQLSQAVDGHGRIHFVLWHNPPDAPAPNHDLGAWRYYHYWRDEAGGWHRQELPFFGRKPRLVVGGNDDAWLVFLKGTDPEYHRQDPGGRLHVAAATAAHQWKDWQVVSVSDRDYVGEPRVDGLRWQSERVVSVYVQQKPSQPGHPSPLRAVDWRVP